MPRFSQPALLQLSLTIAMVALLGCSRTWYRRQADREAACLVGQKGGTLGPHGVYADPLSRLADPSSIDCPPLPPDDPRSHELMHCVDGKKGFRGWHRFGSLGDVENPAWINSLVQDEAGNYVLDLREAVRVARLHSRDYQQNVETLYLSALDVSFERFRFDRQFFSGSDVDFATSGESLGADSELLVGSFAQARQLTATGGEIVVGFANSLLWDFWGTDTDVFSSAIDFSIVQPLLRFGGRARVLENLTQRERTLLANARQMQQYRQGFFVEIVTGRNSGPGPALRGDIGNAGLGLIAGSPGGRSGAPSAGGFLGLLEDQQEIRNQESNIAALRDSLAQLEAAFDANRISSRLQVDQARQALLNAQSSLLIARAAYETRIDAYKIQLGLPPDLDLVIRDSLLDRFILIDPNLTELQNDVEKLLSRLRLMRDAPDESLMDQIRGDILELQPRVAAHRDQVQQEQQRLDDLLPQRRVQLQRVRETIEKLGADVDPRVYDETLLKLRKETLFGRVPEITQKLERILTEAQTPFADRALEEEDLRLESELDEDSTITVSPEKKRWDSLLKIATDLSDALLELSLVGAEIRLQGISLQQTEIDETTAEEFARINRLDWMNARANLVDAWRQIEFTANALKSDLDVRVQGTLGTRPDNIFEFADDRSRLRFGLNFDTPITRLAERNAYREALINYQQARRQYMLFEDRIQQSLRNTLRTITLSEINLEVRRAAVEVAIAQVDIARLKLNPPLKPNQNSSTSPTAARDLVSALSDLLDAQNDFLNVWVANEVLRILLDFEMGTMQLDPMGVWIDTGIAGEKLTTAPRSENLELRDLLIDP